jgi:hypothetical protein
MRALRVCVLVLITAIAVAACGGGGGGGGGGGNTAGLPPVGVVWFGAGLDPATLALTGQATSIKTGTPIFAVGRFLQPKPPEEMTVVISVLGSRLARVPLPAGEPSNAFGVDLTSQNLKPGSYLVDFTDTNRRTLASGNLTVTP